MAADQQVILELSDDGKAYIPRPGFKLSTDCKTGTNLLHISIGHLPDEILLEIFERFRLCDISGWNHKRQWYTLLHVCRKWRYITLDSASRLKLRLLCNPQTPTSDMLMHFPPLPLIVICTSFQTSTELQQNVLLGLENPDRVFSISVNEWSLDFRSLSAAMDRAFPMLEILSLSCGDLPLEFPDNFSVPRLRALRFSSTFPISIISSLLAGAAANLTSFHLEQSADFHHDSPERLVELISSMPQLENLSIIFHTRGVGYAEGELWHTPVQTKLVVLRCLWKLAFTGGSMYLEGMLALISTPLLQCFHVTFFPDQIPTVQSLSAFLGTIQNLNFRMAMVSLSETITIAYYPGQPSDSLSCLMFDVDRPQRLENPDSYRSLQVAAMVQICTTISSALRMVEGLALAFDGANLPDCSSVLKVLWLEFFRSFGTVRALRLDLALIPELSKIFNPNNEAATEELLPKLSELVIVSKDELVPNPFASLIQARGLAGRDVDFQVIQRRPLPPPLSIIQSSDVFEYMI
jgi:hypothetical protein